MKRSDFLQIGFFAAAITLPFAAFAQDATGLPHLQATDMSQYPSILEMTGVAVGGAPGTKFNLRCGYTANGGQIAADPTTDDLELSSANAYTRYQMIGNRSLITGLDPTKPGSPTARPVKVQITEPDGSSKAKSCMQMGQTDTLASCTPTTSFISAQQAAASMSALQAQCSQFMTQLSGQINPAAYDAIKTQAWKAKLSQTVAVVEQ